MNHQARRVKWLAILVTAMLASACTVRGVREAPIEDRSAAPRTAKPAAPAATAPATTPPVLTQRETSNGNYVVQRGDTLYSIAVAFGQDYRDIARWNNLEDPTRISVGQTLRVAPPADDQGAAVVGVVTVNPGATTEARPLESVPLPPPSAAPAPTPPTATAPSAPAPQTTPPAAGAPAPAPSPQATTPTAPPPPVAAVPAPAPAPVEPAKPSPAPPAASGPVLWMWPAKGKVIDGFNEARNKGIDISGAEGEPVLAAGDGEVVYSGNGLRMYGNLVIIKHNDDFISAYAHNKQILVKQGQTVRRGQRIADLGRTDDGQAKLHFEIRYRGKPVDPMKYLPAR